MTDLEDVAPSFTDRVSARVKDGLAESGAHLGRFWPYWLGLSMVAAAAATGFSTGLDRLFERWIYPYDHSYLVLALATWLLISRLKRAELTRVGPSPVGGLAVVAVVLVYALAEILDFTLGMQFMLPMLLLAVLAALVGLKFAGYAALPVAFLYFTIPIWDLLVRPLQEMSAAVVALAVQWTGITAFIEGHRITLAAGAFEIAEGCSGIRYLFNSLAVAAFYGLCWYKRWRTRLLLLAVAGGMAIVSNWIRIYALIVVGDVTSMQHYLIAESHDGFGWVVFIICMAPVLWFAQVARIARAPYRRAGTVEPAGGLIRRAAGSCADHQCDPGGGSIGAGPGPQRRDG
jgi:exosortase